MNPYRYPAGEKLDQFIHEVVLQKNSGDPMPSYSNDPAWAREIQSVLSKNFKTRVVIGRSSLRAQPWFARLGTDPSTCTEVLAESEALAICRLAKVVYTDGP